MLVADRNGHVLLVAAIGWVPVAVGVPLLFRSLTGGPGAGLLPDTTAVVVGVVGVVIGTAGFVWTVRRLREMAVSGVRSRSGRPTEGLRIVVPLGRVPAEYRDTVPSRPQVLRTLVATLVWMFGFALSIGVAPDRPRADTVTVIVLVTLICLVPAGVLAARLRRVGRVR